MWSPSRILRRAVGKRGGSRPSNESRLGAVRRPLRAEQLEPRRLMAADPIHVGIVYIETDYLESDDGWGSDEIADRFIVSFTGGADQTELTQFRVSLDKDGDGLSIGDLIFDTAAGGRGKAGWHPFKVTHIDSLTGEAVEVLAEVDDGATELLVKLTHFKAGDRLEFSVDVDEVLRMHGELDRFNAALDVIASGQELQDAIFSAQFVAPHYQPVTADGLFVNDFGDPAEQFGIRLPPDEGPSVDSRPSRTAAAIAHATQSPKPISIAGTVWVDDNLDLRRDAHETILPGVLVTLLRKDESTGRFVATGHSQRTDAAGGYRFGTDLGLMPGEYQVVQTQPEDFFSVGAVVGSVDSQMVGRAASSDILTGIHIPLGDLHAVDYDFAEARPASVSGWVYRDDNDNGRRDDGEVGLGGVTMRLVPLDTVAPQTPLETVTAADGSYRFAALPPGRYDIIQVTQPEGLDDGRDQAGTVDAKPVGVADDPGDAIRGIVLPGNGHGIDYNFGELPRGIITGGVYLAAPGEACGRRDDPRSKPLADVEVVLVDAQGGHVARTTTDAQGQYRFENIPKGVYSIIEVTPEGLLDGEAHVGSIGGVRVGVAEGGGLIRDIPLPAGATATRYDFCEAAPGKISGFVYHDQNQNGRREASEQPIDGTTIQLINEQGEIVATTTTDARGHYEFIDLLPGEYSICQLQPEGYLDGLDAAGTVDGVPVGAAVNPGDLIAGVLLRQGQQGVEYNFGELLPASLSGRVHLDQDGDCLYDPGEPLLAGVTIRLLDSSGAEVARTTTDAQGRYTFTGIAPGTYTVVQTQPKEYFSGTARPGSAGGVKESSNRIGGITLGSAEVAVEYDFCEKPPAEISGFVYVDHNHNQNRDSDEAAIGGVQIDLLDASGQRVATTTTDASGYYRFTFLPAGRYTLRQTQPAGYLQGSQQAGSAGGDDSVDDLISQVPVAFGAVLTQYNFGELQPASLSGRVHVDFDGDCLYDPGEPLLAGVLIELFDGAGQLVMATHTNDQGFYQFEGLEAGQYRVVETQPEGYFSGAARPGSGGGQAVGGDIIDQIPIGPGAQLTDYNFCEKLPATVSGHVFTDTNLNQRRDAGEAALPDVVIELRDEAGRLMATTRTDAQGHYRFDSLRPGTYSLRQLQPDGYFHGGQFAGSLGGEDSIDDLIAAIVLPSGADAIDYDFAEIPPASISGYVFQDGPPLPRVHAPDPADLRQYRDGIRTPDDQPIAGVVMQLRDEHGKPVSADHALPGFYDAVIEVVTDAQGQYRFVGLRPGNYHVYQLQPAGYIDSLDTAGTHGGVAVNVADLQDDPQLRALLAELAARAETDPRHDAILRIVVLPGGHSEENNFSEILIEMPVPPVVPPAPIHAEVAEPLPQWFTPVEKVFGFGTIPHHIQRPIVASADAEYLVTWHLSIINGGYPRGVLGEEGVRPVSDRSFDTGFTTGDKASGRWMLVGRDGTRMEVGDAITLGEADSQPLVGDFNGDGLDEVAIFVGGQWFVDLNGNGFWDDGDLWLRMGTAMDRPVVGDWDGDGKADIAIFGRQWQRDPEVIIQDPGLPSPANKRRREHAPTEADKKTELAQERLLQHGRRAPIRTDAIDHVFRYGEQPDTPLAGDWRGSGIDSIAVFRDGHWMLDSDADGRFTDRDDQAEFGQPGDIPVTGDWNGDGVTNLGVVRGDLWIIDTDGDRRITGNDRQIRIPRPSDDAQPIVGDWDGDGTDEFGWYHDAG